MALIKATQEQQAERMAICNSCPELKDSKLGKRCQQCGCIMKFKSQLKHGSCPLKKW